MLYALSIAVVAHPALGSMPWDVLSQGLSAQFGWSLGGTVGAGTLLYALSMGPLLQWLLPRFSIRLPGDVQTAAEQTVQAP